MKKITLYLLLGGFLALSAINGCSTAKKEVKEPPPAARVPSAEPLKAPTPPPAPVDLGASSAGRGL